MPSTESSDSKSDDDNQNDKQWDHCNESHESPDLGDGDGHSYSEVVRHLQIATLKASHSYTYALLLSYSFE